MRKKTLGARKVMEMLWLLNQVSFQTTKHVASVARDNEMHKPRKKWTPAVTVRRI
jgi:hypothetical protein